MKCPKCRTENFKNCHSIKCPMRKTHGGKRKGAGRKPIEDKQTRVVLYFKKSFIEKWGLQHIKDVCYEAFI